MNITTGKILVTGLIAAPIVAVLAVYIGLLSDGSIAPPNAAEIVSELVNGTAGAAHLTGATALVVLGAIAAIAPIIYAARSHDLLTLLISLAMTGTAIVLLVSGHTVFDQIIALLIYLANMILASIVYAAYRIAPNR